MKVVISSASLVPISVAGIRLAFGVSVASISLLFGGVNEGKAIALGVDRDRFLKSICSLLGEAEFATLEFQYWLDLRQLSARSRIDWHLFERNNCLSSGLFSATCALSRLLVLSSNRQKLSLFVFSLVTPRLRGRRSHGSCAIAQKNAVISSCQKQSVALPHGVTSLLKSLRPLPGGGDLSGVSVDCP